MWCYAKLKFVYWTQSHKGITDHCFASKFLLLELIVATQQNSLAYSRPQRTSANAKSVSFHFSSDRTSEPLTNQHLSNLTDCIIILLVRVLCLSVYLCAVLVVSACCWFYSRTNMSFRSRQTTIKKSKSYKMC